jgi:hypothetical protein
MLRADDRDPTGRGGQVYGSEGNALSEFAGNMPVNRRMLEMDPSTISGEELIELRRRWDRFHTVRNVLNFFGFASALVGAHSESTDGRSS